MPPADRDFYRNIPAYRDLDAAIAAAPAHSLPADWYVVLSDVSNSTAAIQRGAYKAVNSVGVACIAAIKNIDRACEIPCIFGGDGATLAIPPELTEPTIQALRGTQQMALSAFQLTLRAGLIRAGDLQIQGFQLNLGKQALSAHISQAIFSGNGWLEAERRLKSDDPSGITMVAADAGPTNADFSGFECRWESVPSRKDYKLALLIQATGRHPADNLMIYQHTLKKLDDIFGAADEHHPLQRDALKLSLAPSQLAHEWKIRTARQPSTQKLGYAAKMLTENLAGLYLLQPGQPPDKLSHWSGYRDELVSHTDYRKFDGTLRMVLDASQQQAAQLEAFLAEEQAAGRLSYGTHTSNAALITCIVESHQGKHIHYVDGSEGGYALAAQALKQRLRAHPPSASALSEPPQPAQKH